MMAALLLTFDEIESYPDVLKTKARVVAVLLSSATILAHRRRAKFGEHHSPLITPTRCPAVYFHNQKHRYYGRLSQWLDAARLGLCSL